MPALSRTTVALRIVGDALDPDEITRILSLAPSYCARKGDVRRTTSDREVVAPSGTWQRRAEVPGDLNTQLGALLAKLPDDLSLWSDLSRRYSCDVFCGLFIRDGNEGTDLQPEVLSRLGARGLRLGLDIYYGGPD